MEGEIGKLNKQLSEVAESIISTENKISMLTRGMEDFHYIFHANRRLMLELKNTWQKGNMNIIMQDIDLKLKHHQQDLFNSLEDEQHTLKNSMNTLEDKQLALVYKRKRLEGD